MSFVLLTLPSRDSDQGWPVLINLDRVARIDPADAGAALTLAGDGNPLIVNESFARIKELVGARP